MNDRLYATTVSPNRVVTKATTEGWEFNCPGNCSRQISIMTHCLTPDRGLGVSNGDDYLSRTDR
jgi:hypothetical protein